MRTCHFCQQQVEDEEFCAACVANWAARPEPHTLTPDEREAEMVSLGGPLEVPFDLMHGRIEALVGRPVWTHEMGLNWGGLCKEARWETRPATMAEVIDLIPEAKRLIVAPE